MAAVSHVHSVPVRVHPAPCETIAGHPHPRLRPYVVGYGGFRSGSGAAVRHRVLPMNLVTMIVDFAGPSRLVTGPGSSAVVHEQTAWGDGVAIGLTPAGATAVLGVPMREIVGGTFRLADFLGGREVELAERLGEAPDRPTWFAVLDEYLTARLAAAPQPDGLTMHAWWRLQRSADRLRISALADELDVGRRNLELRFQREVGLSPGAVARIARFQRAVHMLTRSAGLLRTAVDCGYADQPHFNREIRAMSGLTPTQLCAFLQYRELAPG
ncbi:helix-turn-helix domain-containing protein [Dactylosporangium sp. AC04546]|uniref:AraC family transcriptional regulator n=1 Tax=Dactylosporangium sp. AC04546 TaxID=2862460 RepID=UPI0027DF6B84|nr:helix-turn-helix domain-containing protein [Dactylosporangium sp. AC04546]WVK89583.1 helix-turn-helix domain-containing protein [Dactylosporangium sp. AC04546]